MNRFDRSLNLTRLQRRNAVKHVVRDDPFNTLQKRLVLAVDAHKPVNYREAPRFEGCPGLATRML
jgi:hypothetical protein